MYDVHTAVEFIAAISTVEDTITDFTLWDAVTSRSTLELIAAAC